MEELPKFPPELSRRRAARNREAMDKVIAYFVDGSKMARALGISKSYISMLDEIPAKYVRLLSAMTGMRPDEILPDPFPYDPIKQIRKPREKAKKRQGRKAGGAEG